MNSARRSLGCGPKRYRVYACDGHVDDLEDLRLLTLWKSSGPGSARPRSRLLSVDGRQINLDADGWEIPSKPGFVSYLH